MLAVALMVVDHHYKRLQSLRWYVSAVVTPLQLTVDWPLQFIKQLHTTVRQQQRLLRNNAHLRSELLLLKGKVQKDVALKKENEQLRALLQSTIHHQEYTEVATVLAVYPGSDQRQFVLSKGSNEGVFIGQAVLDANGVFGQIVSVGPVTSRVMLLVDQRSAVPVQNPQTGLRAIATGMEPNVLLLQNVPQTAVINKGDLFLSSGLGQRYPEGYPVGIVTKVEHNPGERFARIELEPCAHINHSNLVLLVWPKDPKKNA